MKKFLLKAMAVMLTFVFIVAAVPAISIPVAAADCAGWNLTDANTGKITCTCGRESMTPTVYFSPDALQNPPLNQGYTVTKHTEGGLSYARFKGSTVQGHVQYIKSGMPQYIAMQYRAQSGVFPQAVFTYYEATYISSQLGVSAITCDNSWRTTIVDMKGPQSASAPGVLGFLPDLNASGKNMDVTYIALFSNSSDANTYNIRRSANDPDGCGYKEPVVTPDPDPEPELPAYYKMGANLSSVGGNTVALAGHATMPASYAYNKTAPDNKLQAVGWCMIDGGQQNNIQWSADGGANWNSASASFSDGNQAHIDAITAFVQMPNPSVSGAVFDATADLSSLTPGATYSITFGRVGNDGVTYKFLTVTGVTIAAHTHIYNLNSATCTEDMVCTSCGHVAETATGHSYSSTVTGATCTSGGYTTHTCSKCGNTYVDSYTDTTAHNFSITIPAVPATCTSTGLTSGTKCANCGTIGTSQTVTPTDPSRHDFEGQPYQSDEEGHWRVCSGCMEPEAKSAHTEGAAECPVCHRGCAHIGGAEATCTEPQTCTRCGSVVSPALGHEYSTNYSKTDTHHWKVCLRAGCTEKGNYAEHEYQNNRCVCGDKLNTLPDHHSSVNSINGTTNTTATGNTNSGGAVSIPLPSSANVKYVRLDGWALVYGGITGYKWSIDGINWNDCTYTTLTNADSSHLALASGSGITSSNSTSNAVFTGLCADLSAYNGQKGLSVTFAACDSEGTPVPFVIVTGVNVGTPVTEAGHHAFDKFTIGNASQGYNGFVSGVVGGVTVGCPDVSAGTLNLSGLLAGTPLSIKGWIGYDAEIDSFGYYLNNYSGNIVSSPAIAAEQAVINAGGKYAKRFLIEIPDGIPVGTTKITFIVRFKDGSTTTLATWNVALGSGSGHISKDYANVIIIGGQSNAYGASPSTDPNYNIGQLYADVDFSNIKIHYSNINLNNNTGKWESLFNNSGFNTYQIGVGAQDPTQSIGPEFGLAHYLTENYTNGEEFYIIKFTAAGTAINGDWFVGDANSAVGTRIPDTMGGKYLYQQMKEYINESLGLIAQETNKEIKIHSFMWMQGEAEAGSIAQTQSYVKYEQLLAGSVRADFVAYAPEGGISFIDATISNGVASNNFAGIFTQGQKIWAQSEALNAVKESNAQYQILTTGNDNVDGAVGIIPTQNSTYGIKNSLLINKTDWKSQGDDGFVYSANAALGGDVAHFGAKSQHTLGYSFGVAMTYLDENVTNPHVHTSVAIPKVEATCTDSGLTAGTKCSECGEILVAQTLIPSVGHTYDNDDDMFCNNCGESRATECEHEYIANVYDTTNPNYHCNICVLCFAELNASAHVYDANISCDTTCNICGYVRDGVTHTPEVRDEVAPTCITYGMKTCTVCSECGYVIVAGELIDMIPHSFTNVETVGATCSSRGYTSHTCVNGCAKSYYTDLSSPTAHSYVQSSTVAPTCTEMGYTVYACAGCGGTYNSDYTPAAGHTYAASTVEAGCTTYGYTVYACTQSGCTSSYNTNYVSAKGHTYVASVVEATCVLGGHTLYTCACGSQYKADLTATAEHTYVAKTTVSATCTTVGYTVYECSCDECDASYKVNFIACTGHTYKSEINASTGETTHTCTGGCGSTYVTKNEE